MSLNETPEAVPSPAANMAAEVERRAALLPGAKPKEVAPAKENVAPGEAPKAVSGATGTAAAGTAATPATPAAPPSATPGQDVSWVPEELRSFAETADEKARAKLRELYFKADDYTKKTMTVAEERRALEQRKIAAEYGEAILGNPKWRRAVDEIVTAEEAPPAEAPFDYLSSTAEEIKAHEAALIKKASDAAIEAFRKEQAALNGHTSVMREMANKAHAEFVKSGEYDDAAVNAAYAKLESAGVKFSVDNVVEALRWVLPKKAPAPTSPPVAQPPESPTSGASALTRGAGVSPAYRVPAFIANGKGPQTRDERVAQTFYEVNKARAAKGLPPLG